MAHRPPTRQRSLGATWNGFLGFIAVLAILGIYLNIALPFAGRITHRVQPDAWMRLIGIILLGLVGTHLMTYWIGQWLQAKLLIGRSKNDELEMANRLSPALVGLCESVMYPTALVIGKSEFIGFWIAAKIAGSWVRWATHHDPQHDPDAPDQGRRRFNRFLIGNSLSIIGALATYAALKIWVL